MDAGVFVYQFASAKLLCFNPIKGSAYNHNNVKIIFNKTDGNRLLRKRTFSQVIGSFYQRNRDI